MRKVGRERFIKRGMQKKDMLDRLVFAVVMIAVIVAVVYFLSR